MNTLPCFYLDPSFDAISQIKEAGEVIVDGLFSSKPYQNSDLKLVLLIDKYLVQY
jgi:hypothetical protein